MGNNNLQSTHENIHTGLSGLNNDEKWQDMLNFRSAQGRTAVVPHKFKLAEQECFGLHTIIAGLSGHNFAIGSCGSFGFIGADNFRPYPLWRLSQKFLGEQTDRGEQSQRLLVQGAYTGNQPLKLRVHYIEGKLVPFWAVPTPVAPPEVPVEPDYGCDIGGGDQFLVTGIITDNSDDTPILGVSVAFRRFNIAVFSDTTDSLGKYSIADFYSAYYELKLTHPDYLDVKENILINVTTDISRVMYNRAAWPDWSLLYKTYASETLVAVTLPFSYGDTFFEAILTHTETADTDLDTTENWKQIPPWGLAVGGWVAGDICYAADGNRYQCIDSHPGSPGHEPAVAVDWADYWSLNGALIEPTIEWARQDQYLVGAGVVADNIRYTCILDHTPNTVIRRPGTGSFWELYWVLAP